MNKMSFLKKYTSIFLFIALTSLSSCNPYNRIDDDSLYNDEDVTVIEINEDRKVVVRKDYYDTYSFSNWNAYNVANTQIHQVENNKFNSSPKRIVNLEKSISNLSATIPNWIKTEDILEEIAEIEQEYETLLSEKDKSTKKLEKIGRI